MNSLLGSQLFGVAVSASVSAGLSAAVAETPAELGQRLLEQRIAPGPSSPAQEGDGLATLLPSYSILCDPKESF